MSVCVSVCVNVSAVCACHSLGVAATTYIPPSMSVFARMCVCAYVRVSVCVRACVHLCMRVCVSVRVCVFVSGGAIQRERRERERE